MQRNFINIRSISILDNLLTAIVKQTGLKRMPDVMALPESEENLSKGVSCL